MCTPDIYYWYVLLKYTYVLLLKANSFDFCSFIFEWFSCNSLLDFIRFCSTSQVVVKLSAIYAAAVLSFTDQLVDPIEKTLTKKPKEGQAAPELEVCLVGSCWVLFTFILGIVVKNVFYSERAMCFKYVICFTLIRCGKLVSLLHCSFMCFRLLCIYLVLFATPCKSCLSPIMSMVSISYRCEPCFEDRLRILYTCSYLQCYRSRFKINAYNPCI